MRVDRLNILANFMDDLPSDRCTMAAFTDGGTYTSKHCGTSGCAAGWSVVLFHREGIVFTSDGIPIFDGNRGAKAFASFFEIPNEVAGSIVFGNYGDLYLDEVTPRMVATRIREVIRALGGEVVEDYPVPEVAGVVTCGPQHEGMT